MSPQIAGVAVPRQDVDAVLAVVAELQRVQQNALVEDFMELFHENAIWTTGHGKLLAGREEIGAFTRKVLPSALHEAVTAAFEAEHILFLRPDVAAVKIRQLPVTRDGVSLGEEFGTHEDPGALVAQQPDLAPGTPLHVLTKEEGVWRVAAAQNTKVIDPETLRRWFTAPG